MGIPYTSGDDVNIHLAESTFGHKCNLCGIGQLYPPHKMGRNCLKHWFSQQNGVGSPVFNILEFE
jgi:hypothetical protein